MQEGSLFSTSSLAFICRFSNDGHSELCEVIPHCSFYFYLFILKIIYLFIFNFIIIIFYFTILYWFCHTSTCIHHGCTCVPHPEPPSHIPPHDSVDFWRVSGLLMILAMHFDPNALEVHLLLLEVILYSSYLYSSIGHFLYDSSVSTFLPW